MRLLLILFANLLPIAAMAQPSHEDINRTVLDNGLTLIVAPDHSAPLVAVHLWYRVGSVNDPQGRSGFAHLFEHLMFRGSENAPGDHWADMRRIGATDTNAGVAPDRTTYFQTVPTGALEYVLWREADRMAALAPELTQEALASERAIVQNELRQNRSGPAGSVWARVAAATYPDHPYARDTLGEQDELEAASLEEVRAFHKRYYVPSNTILVLAGDVTPESARELVERYFGPIPAGARVDGPEEWPLPLAAARRDVVADAVPAPRIFRVWNLPGYGTSEAIDLGLFADVLNERLEAAPTNDSPVSMARSFLIEQGLGSQLVIDATAESDAHPADVEGWLSEQLESTIANVEDRAITAAGAERRVNLLARLERLGGFGGRADTIASSEGFNADPMAWRERLSRYSSPDANAMRAAAREWIADKHYTLVFVPAASVSEQANSRPLTPPLIVETAEFVPPQAETTEVGKTRLTVLDRRGELARLALILPGAERNDDRAGARAIALAAMLGQPASDARSVRETLDQLGATVTLEEHPDAAVALLRAPSDRFTNASDLLMQAIDLSEISHEIATTSASFVRADVAAKRSNVLTLTSHLVPQLRGGHASDAASLARVSITDLQNISVCWRSTGLHAVYVGPTAPEVIERLRTSLEQAVSESARNCAPARARAVAKNDIAINMPSDQSMVLAALPLPAVGADGSEGLNTALAILTANTTGRLDRILRVERGWTYGVRTTVSHESGSRLLTIEVPVALENVMNTRAIIEREMRRIGEEPVSEAELIAANASLSAERIAGWQTGDQAALKIARNLLSGGDGSGFQAAGAEVVRTSAKRYLMDSPSWIVVGPEL